MANAASMTERTMVAALVLQCVIVEKGLDELDAKQAARTAINFADALIEALSDAPGERQAGSEGSKKTRHWRTEPAFLITVRSRSQSIIFLTEIDMHSDGSGNLEDFRGRVIQETGRLLKHEL